MAVRLADNSRKGPKIGNPIQFGARANMPSRLFFVGGPCLEILEA
jgi:hypothetical protein